MITIHENFLLMFVVLGIIIGWAAHERYKLNKEIDEHQKRVAEYKLKVEAYNKKYSKSRK